MARPSVNLLVNNSANDVVCSNPAGDSNYILFAAGDYLTWRDTQQLDDDSMTAGSYPVLIPESGEDDAPKMFLGDVSEGKFKQIVNAGNASASRYVLAAYFTCEPVTIPRLEAWDDLTHTTAASRPLGNGTPADSCFRAIATTDAAPSVDWVGTPIAGAANYVSLTSALWSGAKYLYWNMRMVVDDSMLAWATEDWLNSDLVLALHFTYN